MNELSENVRNFLNTREGRRISRLANTGITFDECPDCGHCHISVRLHRTEILSTECRNYPESAQPSRRRSCFQVLTLHHGGWKTVTTKRRMGEVLRELAIRQSADHPRFLQIWQREFEWYIGGDQWPAHNRAEAIVGTINDRPDGLACIVGEWWPQDLPADRAAVYLRVHSELLGPVFSPGR